MRYIISDFSMSIRVMTRNPKNLSNVIYNVFLMRNYDNLMRRVKGQKWIDWKNNKAITNTHKSF